MTLTVAQLFNEAAKKLRVEFEYIRSTNPHPGEKGAEAEDVVRQFLNNHLPQRFRATSGIIIDKANSLSPQTDVIVYDALTSPVYRYSEGMLILPLDTVAAVIEVKSRLNKKEIEDGYEKIAACKRLKKTPVSGGDQQATGSNLKTVGTYGVIFGFSSDTSLATLAEHAERLNAQYEPTAWPDLIVLLDSGTISYGAQFPGASEMGSMMLPADDAFPIPPMNIYLMLREDADFTLNRFFILLLLHLTFFPRRIGTPPFEQILEGATDIGMNLRAYQYTRDRKLTPVPDALYKDRANLIPLTITITDDAGKLRGTLRYFPWIDGAVLAWTGTLPLAPLLIPLGDIGFTTTTHQGTVEYSNPIALTESDFRSWPDKLNTSLTNLRAQLSGFTLKRAFNEGTSEPFVARLIAGMFEIRDRTFEKPHDRQGFDAAYSPVLQNLIEARAIYRQRLGMPSGISVSDFQGSDGQQAPYPEVVENTLKAMSGVFTFFGLPSVSLTEADDSAFGAGVASTYAYDPELATFLLGCRSGWLKGWTETPAKGSGADSNDAPASVGISFGHLAALVEEVCVHLLSKQLTTKMRSLIIREILRENRSPDFMRRFEVVLAAEGATKWTLQYTQAGFDDL